MTTKPATAVADFHEDEGAGLYQRHGQANYVISPTKGARVHGRVTVGMTSHDETHDSRRDKVTYPAMWVDFTPMRDDREHGNNRWLLTVNGRDYGAGFAETVTGRVELFPLDGWSHLADYGYPRITVAGVDYVARFSMNLFDRVTDAASAALEALANAIAAQFITDAHWLAHAAAQARYRVERRQEDVDKAQAALAEASEELSAAQAALAAQVHA